MMVANDSPENLLFDCLNVSPIAPVMTMEPHMWPRPRIGTNLGGMSANGANMNMISSGFEGYNGFGLGGIA